MCSRNSFAPAAAAHLNQPLQMFLLFELWKVTFVCIVISPCYSTVVLCLSCGFFSCLSPYQEVLEYFLSYLCCLRLQSLSNILSMWMYVFSVAEKQIYL